MAKKSTSKKNETPTAAEMLAADILESPSPNSIRGRSAQRQASPFRKLSSLSTTSLTSLLPNFYSSTSDTGADTYLGDRARSVTPRGNGSGSGTTQSSDVAKERRVSDLLARESDVIVSTNITSQAEYKGFASYVISGTFLTLWLFWSICPDYILNEQFGIYYYPSRWWALAVPSIILVSMAYTYAALAAYNVEIETEKLDSLGTMVDDSGIVVTELSHYDETKKQDFLFKSTSGIWDLSICDVNQVLYSDAYS